MLTTLSRGCAFAILCSIGVATPLRAQTVADPWYAEFTASPDHGTIVDGLPMLTGYTLQFYLPGALQPFQSAPLGKPAPSGSSLIRIDLTATLTAFPAPGVVYEARVSAEGPGGTSLSEVSNPFQFTNPCTFTLSPSSAAASAGASSGSFTVTTAAGCPWTATSNQSWLTMTSGATGSGSGQVTYAVAANPTALGRTATITAGGQAFTVAQAGVACTFGASPASANVPAGASSNSIAVTATPGCSWTSSSSSPWITITAGASGAGNGATTYSVAANTSTSPRTGHLTVAGVSITIAQAGAPCTFSINPASASFSAAASTASLSLSTLAGCSWTASSNVPWIAITDGAWGFGSATVFYSVAANSGTAARSGTITAAGRTFTVYQAASACSFTVTPTALTLAAIGGPATIAVSTAGSCAWTAASNAPWISVSSGQSGTGAGSVTVQLAPYSAVTDRTGTVTVAGATVRITQKGLSGPLPPTNLRIVR